MSVLKFISCLYLCLVYVNSLALDGQSSKRYVPCGLGVIYFDKIFDKWWHGSIQLGLYNLSYAEVEFKFENSVELYDYRKGKNEGANFKILFPEPSPYYFGIKQKDNEPIPAIKLFKVNNIVLCNHSEKDLQTIQTENLTTREEKKGLTCGRPIRKLSEQFNVNTNAGMGEWPWHVAIFHKITDSSDPILKIQYECGGTIISPYAILTAGHCVRSASSTLEPSNVFVMAGVIDYSDVNNSNQWFWAKKIILHPSYDDRRATADLAIIKVDEIRFNENVQPICLWGPNYEKSALYAQEAVIVGFGRTEDDDLPRHLRSARVMVQNDSICINFDPRLYSLLLDEFTFCAGYGSQVAINPRNGDSGGGLVFPLVQEDQKISWTLRGVMSKCGVGKGETLCNPRYYSVYTDAAPYYSWVYHHSGKVV